MAFDIYAITENAINSRKYQIIFKMTQLKMVETKQSPCSPLSLLGSCCYQAYKETGVEYHVHSKENGSRNNIAPLNSTSPQRSSQIQNLLQKGVLIVKHLSDPQDFVQRVSGKYSGRNQFTGKLEVHLRDFFLPGFFHGSRKHLHELAWGNLLFYLTFGIYEGWVYFDSEMVGSLKLFLKEKYNMSYLSFFF